MVEGRHLKSGARYETDGPDDAERMTPGMREWRRTPVPSRCRSW
ncbi:hypothetical protein [Streptomyces sp. 2131.1]|nr:hypothetical protein [Streptomyces sp. 2131.1]